MNFPIKFDVLRYSSSATILWPKYLFRLFGTFFTVCCLIFFSSPVQALSESQLDMFAQNNILFYDPDENMDECISYNYVSKPSGDQITWIGDSYTVGAKDKILNKLPGVDLGTERTPQNYQSSKRFYYDITGSTAATSYGNVGADNPSGMTILQDLADNNLLRDYVVFALGTNDQGIATETFSDYIDTLVSIAGANRTIILMTPRTKNYTYDSVIEAMKQASQNNSKIIIADWASAVSQDLDAYFSADEIHPNSAGYDLFVETIYDALPGGSVGLLAGSNNTEKIWNYFATANISGVSDNPAVISGIIGNLLAESSANPFAHTDGSSYYGIYQTNAPELLQAMETAGLSQYWGRDDAPQDAVDRAMQIQLDFLTQQNERFLGTGWASGFGFLVNLGNVSQKTPEGFSDLFVMSVEGAVTSDAGYAGYDSNLLDEGVIAIGTRHFGSSNGGGRLYQGASHRRDLARETFNAYAGTSASTAIVASGSYTGEAVWEDGWLVDGSLPGLTKQDASQVSLRETPQPSFSTPNGKPNMIILHYTAGTSNGLAAYGDNLFPAHFTIDLKKKETYQHFPVDKPSLASVGYDGYSIQFEIVGVGYDDWAGVDPNSDYNLKNFTDDDWDYLALFLIAVSAETGIPLTSSVTWDKSWSADGGNASTMTDEEAKSYRGILGHMHLPQNDGKSDPGDIWDEVAAAIARDPDGAKFMQGGSLNECITQYSAGLVAGGMTKEEADAFMQIYRDIEPREWGTGGVLGTEWDIAATNTCTSDLENCVAFTQYFINRYTTKHFTGLPNGSEVVNRLLANGFTDGGTTPRAYAIFSIASGTTMCGSKACGHTGVVLGINTTDNTIIVGEAGCSASFEWTGAHEYSLDQFTNGSYYYAYTDGLLKGI